MSMAMTVAPCALASSSSSAFCAGQKNEISVWPWRRQLDLGLVGGRTFATTSVAA